MNYSPMESQRLQGPPMTPPRTTTGVVMSPPNSVAASSMVSMASPSRFKSPSLTRSPGTQRSEKVAEEPRLVIRKLVLINYKSYAGRQEVGPFNTSFTAVVGPNGSGKSNVIDSLLFVFGFRAKKMRQDKLTGLIHNSEKEPNLKFARVEVHFETTGVPDSQLILAREVRRDGSNFYMLNNKRASYSEVSELLESKGIDLRHKRFLILQGEVESIALMPPKAENDGEDGLLEYLEDIIGTSSYKLNIEELNTMSEELKVECGEKQRRVEHISKDLKKLDAERSDVETYIVNKNRSTRARSQLWQVKRYKQRVNVEVLEKELEEKRQVLKDTKALISEKRTNLEQIEEQIKAKDHEAKDLKSKYAVANKKLKEIQVLEAKAKQQKVQQNAKRSKAEKSLSNARNEALQAQMWLDNYATDTAALEDSLKQLTKRESDERKLLEQIQGELHESTKDLHGELQALQYEAEPWRIEIADIDHELKMLDSERAEAAEKVSIARQRESEFREQAELLIKKGKTNKEDLKQAQETYSKLLQEQENTEMNIKEFEKQKETAESKWEQLKPELAAAKEASVSNQSRNKIEQALKNTPGFYGRLGSLGTIDAKYDIAVSTAAPELNNLVVDTVETAQKCIKVLRERSLGRARFMPLDKLSSPNMRHASNFPAPRLIDLVKPKDSTLYKAFSSAIGDTLVVDNLQQANKVAFSGSRRHKVVTLDGGLVQVSGQMSGGGAPMRGLMSHVANTLSAEELSALEYEVTKSEMALHEVRSALSENISKKEELEITVPRAKGEVEKLKLSLEEASQQMLSVRKDRHVIESETKAAVQAESQVLNASKLKEDESLNKKRELEMRSSSIEKSIEKIQEQIMQAGGVRLREQKSKVDDITIQLEETQRRINEGRENLGQQMSRNKKFTAEISRFEKELQTYSENDDTVDNIPDASELRTQLESLSVNLQATENGIEDFKATCASLRNEIESSRSNEVESQHEVDNNTRKLKGCITILQDLERDLNSLKLYDEAIARPISLERSSKDDEEMLGSESHASTELNELSPDELESVNVQDLEAIINQHEKACEGKRLDLEALERYRGRFNEYRERKEISDESVRKYEQVKDDYERLKNRRLTKFMNGFYQISAKLKEMYQLITMGGNAELELVDSMDPFSEGILFSVMPPKKSWRNIANLSGGEKTLSSLALVFALHHYKPTPLYVMDEIDAALDFRNVSIIANYIKERTKNGQFIVISLRNNMFELASRLVGVYKVNNMTRSATLQVTAEE